MVDWGDVPTWIQAVASPAAIVAAFIVGRQQSRDAERIARSEMELRATAIAVSLYFELKEMQNILSELVKTIEYRKKNGGNALTKSDIQNWKLQIPETLMSFRDQIYVLGYDSSKPLLQFLAWLLHFNRMLTEAERQDSVGIKKDPHVRFELIHQYPIWMKKILDEAIDKINPIHDREA